MTYHNDLNEDNSQVSGFDYEAAYSAAENATLDPKNARESRADVIEKELEQAETPRQTRARMREKEKRSKHLKRFFIIAAAVLAAAALAALAFFYIQKNRQANESEEGSAVLTTETDSAVVSEIYTYGTHLNISGILPADLASADGNADIDLVLYNGEFISVPIVVSDGTFTISEQYNGGLLLENISRDTYKMFIRLTSAEPFDETDEAAEENAASDGEGTADTDSPAGSGTGDDPQSMLNSDSEMTGENENESSSSLALEKKKPEDESEEETVSSDAGEAAENDADGSPEETPIEEDSGEKYYKYYTIVNNSGYDETVYYTMSSAGNCVVIGNEYDYPTMQMTVSENTNEDVYDVVIDPGHGGQDKGAAGIDGHTEIEYMLPLALKIKEKLEAEGVRVALTRDNDSETLDTYGEDGRIARACSTEAKYMLSLHMNDAGTGTGGLEIYTYCNLDYTFANTLNDNIQTASGLADSANIGQIGHDLYTQQFTQKDIDELIAENTAAGLKPYEPTTRSSYYYIIRETGGIVTGAFRDDRNPQEKYNPYCYDNTGLETYILQLGYITHEEDLNIMTAKMDEIATAIAESLLSVY